MTQTNWSERKYVNCWGWTVFELAERITVVVAAVSIAAAACSFKSIFKSHAEKMTIFSEHFLVRF